MPDIAGPYVLEDGDARAVVQLELYSEDGRSICGLYRLDGAIFGPLRPKQWMRKVRAVVRELEAAAKQAGCAEMRIAGRDWSRVLPDYERYDGPQNGLRKVL